MMQKLRMFFIGSNKISDKDTIFSETLLPQFGLPFAVSCRIRIFAARIYKGFEKMWLTLAFTSAALLGFYDAAKKKSLTDNAVLPVLLLNTFFSTLIFLPAVLSSELQLGWFDGTVLDTDPGTWYAHGLVVLKSIIVLTSWVFGYYGMKHLPITIVGPINATRPVMVLVGAMLVFGERLNGFQWTGVALALVSLFC